MCDGEKLSDISSLNLCMRPCLTLCLLPLTLFLQLPPSSSSATFSPFVSTSTAVPLEKLSLVASAKAS